jgi:hypothetical protein
VSLKVDYFLLRKDKFEEFCQKKNLVPGRSPTIEEMEEGGKGTGQIRLVTQSEMNSPEFRKRMADNKKLWAYFDQFLDAPFKFNWGGIVISELVYCLRSMDVVDLTEHSLIPEGGGFDWWVIDEKQKAKFLRKLKPSKFSEEALRDMYFDSMRKDLEKQFSKMFGKKNAEKQLASYFQKLDEDFPERGEAMLDAVKWLCKYLEQIDETKVLMLTVYH